MDHEYNWEIKNSSEGKKLNINDKSPCQLLAEMTLRGPHFFRKQEIETPVSQSRLLEDSLDDIVPELPNKARTYEEDLKYSLAADAKFELGLCSRPASV